MSPQKKNPEKSLPPLPAEYSNRTPQANTSQPRTHTDGGGGTEEQQDFPGGYNTVFSSITAKGNAVMKNGNQYYASGPPGTGDKTYYSAIAGKDDSSMHNGNQYYNNSTPGPRDRTYYKSIVGEDHSTMVNGHQRSNDTSNSAGGNQSTGN
ncbi:hypothetical protein K469DRAFT_717370 [Zopfia rhizophila CBS 207.26]|uniref:Uncharacterized protein n=1 Tax=Zopfia rhizophila CBS 207.26 TaxID=1314779 RepID=A0A6A6EPS5_9PEZI|nr:hypothetical protein K469DRAFT_717370 [Zopfia rhizophila CBS 207.26]